jgi:hypothetical protein
VTIRRRAARVLVGAACAVGLGSLAACGVAGQRTASSAAPGAALEAYLARIEPLRLGVNALLGGADPILEGYRSGRLSPARAGARMDTLERRFAAATVDVAGVVPTDPALRPLAAEYAHTYVLEDAYLSALASGLAERNLDQLPDTQAAQRAAIIDWRTGLTVLARAEHVALPADLQQAGRGEIAPSPGGS